MTLTPTDRPAPPESPAPVNGVGGARAQLRVRGDATAEEVVAVLAALSRPDGSDRGDGASGDGASGDGASGYERWRRGRLQAIRSALPAR